MVTGQEGVVGLLSAVGNTLRGVGLGLAAEVEVAAGGSQRQEVDGRGGTSGSDTESTVVVTGSMARAGEGRSQRSERQNSRDLHCEV